MDTVNIDAVTAAQSEDAFDVLSFVQGTAYPTAEVVVFVDAESAAEYLKLVEKRSALEEKQLKSEEPIDTSQFDKQIDILSDKLQASALIFKLRGLPPGILEDLNTKHFPEGEDEKATGWAAASAARDDELISMTVTEITNAKGVKDTKPFTPESVNTLRRYLKAGEFGKIVAAVVEVNFTARLFDRLTDAGFSGRSADVA